MQAACWCKQHVEMKQLCICRIVKNTRESLTRTPPAARRRGPGHAIPHAQAASRSALHTQVPSLPRHTHLRTSSPPRLVTITHSQHSHMVALPSRRHESTPTHPPTNEDTSAAELPCAITECESPSLASVSGTSLDTTRVRVLHSSFASSAARRVRATASAAASAEKKQPSECFLPPYQSLAK